MLVLCCQFCGCFSNIRLTQQDLPHSLFSFVSVFGVSDVFCDELSDFREAKKPWVLDYLTIF